MNVFRSAAAHSAPPTSPTSTLDQVSEVVFVAGLKGEEWAHAHELDGEFTVLEGSRAKRWSGTSNSYVALQKKLIADGTLQPAEDPAWLRFTHDQVFTSPSAASAIVLGRNSNGKLEWKLQGSATTYAQWLVKRAETA